MFSTSCEESSCKVVVSVAVKFDLVCLATFNGPWQFDLVVHPDKTLFTAHLS